MKYIILSLALGIGLSGDPPGDPPTATGSASAACVETPGPSNTLSFQEQDPGSSKMSAAVFRAQKFCRAEIEPDFPFDVHYSIVGAKVYFSGTNFHGVEYGSLTSGSLDPLAPMMKRCAPGTIVIFDDVKVYGPEKTVRPIDGLSLMLH